jgi:serine protease Do
MSIRRFVLAGTLVTAGIVIGLVVSAESPIGVPLVAPARVMAKTPTPTVAEAVPLDVARDLRAAASLSRAFQWVAAKAVPAVVMIRSERVVRAQQKAQWLPDFFPHGYAPRNREPESVPLEGLGSGVIVDSKGYILTNNHVIKGADKITVVIGEDEEVQAKVIGADPRTDLAVIRVEVGRSLPVLPMANSDSLNVGEWVIAVGSPFAADLRHTVTAGIISALGRDIGIIPTRRKYSGFENFIQTDAAINPGNSGGALVNIEGKLVGINTAISSTSGSNSGIGFAIPINMARSVMKQLVEHGRVRRGYLGVTLRSLTAELQEGLRLPDRRGALINSVGRGGPAEKAGLKHGDVIRGINGSETMSLSELRYKVASTSPGSKVRLTVWRKGRERTIDVVLDELPERFQLPSEAEKRVLSDGIVSRLGLSVSDITSEARRRFRIEGSQGVVVTSVKPGSHASRRGLRAGDLIQEVNLKRISSVSAFEEAIKNAKPGDPVLLFVTRPDGEFFVGLRVPAPKK